MVSYIIYTTSQAADIQLYFRMQNPGPLISGGLAGFTDNRKCSAKERSPEDNENMRKMRKYIQ